MKLSPYSLTTFCLVLAAPLWACSSSDIPTEGTGGDGDGGTPVGVGDPVDADGDGVIDGTGLDTDGDGIVDAFDADGDGVADGTVSKEVAMGGGTGGTSGGTGGAGNPGTGGAGTGGAGTGGTVSGEPNATAPASSTTNTDYFKMGDLRLINNAWGSAELECSTDYEIFINADKSFGWTFDREDCNDSQGQKPDYPEVEFGIHPFGTNKALVTSPDSSSTALLPLQIKDITTASASISNLQVSLEAEGSFNMNFELWVTTDHPVTGSHTGAYAELMTFWGWQSGRWPCDQSGTVSAGTHTYDLCHQSDSWGEKPNNWRYYQYRVQGGPLNTFNGTLDIKAMLDELVSTHGWSPDLWISRFEIGTEIGDKTKGRVQMDNVTFEVNGTSKSAEFAN